MPRTLLRKGVNLSELPVKKDEDERPAVCVQATKNNNDFLGGAFFSPYPPPERSYLSL